jgi:GT2 family glycosyltransferase
MSKYIPPSSDESTGVLRSSPWRRLLQAAGLCKSGLGQSDRTAPSEPESTPLDARANGADSAEPKQRAVNCVNEQPAKSADRDRILADSLRALRADREAFKQIVDQARIADLKQDILLQFFTAAKTVRKRAGQIPNGFYFDGRNLRSASPLRPAPRALKRAERREIEEANLFDKDFYLSCNPDVAASSNDPVEHFLAHGLLEDRDPHPLFSCAWYRRVCRDIGDAAPLLHFLQDGRRRGLSPHPLFDAKYYVAANDLRSLDGLDPFTHYLQKGAARRLDPHPLVQMRRLTQRTELAEAANPLVAFLRDPTMFLFSPHPIFDNIFYLTENRDVAQLGCNPLLHYCVIGWRQGREPHRAFAGDWYLAQNSDVLSADLNPLEHFVLSGATESRSPHPLFDTNFFLDHNSDARKSAEDPLSFYLLSDHPDQMQTTEKASVPQLRQQVPEVFWPKFDPISAFVHFSQTGVSVPTFSDDVDAELGVPINFRWPPRPKPVYWLAQKLRDFLIYRAGQDCLPLYVFLMSVVDRFGDQPDLFRQSGEFGVLCERLNQLAQDRGAASSVDVSIVIPVYNNLVFTITAVLSILENASRFSYEIIIGDDRSTDGTQDVFLAAGGPISVMRHEKNLGFLGNCNACAENAKGRFVVMLNNDTLALPGWLDELIGVFDDPRVGFSGSKLLNADGTLQEAGGIYWKDGSAWNFGRNDDPRHPQFNYAKDIDYISGASIALPTPLWRKLGGFDPLYSPAYCEDADIAFRVRKEGLRTVYAPLSEIVHHEGKSHGRDTSGGVKAYQIVNQEKLLARWSDVLAREHFPNAQDIFLARDHSQGHPHLLVVDHYIPQWDRDAGSRNMFHYIRMFLAQGFHVTLWPDNLFEDVSYCRVLQRMGVEVIYGKAFQGRFENYMQANGKYFDHALLSRPHIAIKYYEAIRAHSACKILYYGHDIHFKRMELEAKTGGGDESAAAIAETRAHELENWEKADVVLYPSYEEGDEVRRIMPSKAASHVPLFGYTDGELATGRDNLANFAQRDCDTLMFVGGVHPPNVDGLTWFASEVMPLVLRERPKLRFHIVGDVKASSIASLAEENVVLRGRLSDEALAELYRVVGASVIPLRFGGGVKGKTIEALFHAAPFVTTSIGMQGLLTEKPIALVADTAEEFAAAVLSALSSRAQARERVVNGLEFIDSHYSIEALRKSYARYVPQLDQSKK